MDKNNLNVTTHFFFAVTKVNNPNWSDFFFFFF